MVWFLTLDARLIIRYSIVNATALSRINRISRMPNLSEVLRLQLVSLEVAELRCLLILIRHCPLYNGRLLTCTIANDSTYLSQLNVD